MLKFFVIVLTLASLGCNLTVIRTAVPLPIGTSTPITLLTQAASVIPSSSVPPVTGVLGPTSTPLITVTPLPTETPLPTLDMPYGDVSGLLGGICFKYLATLAGQSLAFSSTGDLAAFFDAANQSKKCQEFILRPAFDFSTKQILGTILTAQGCGIVLHYDRTDEDDKAQMRIIIIQATPTGDCPYTLVEPILLAVDRPAAGFKLELSVTKNNP